MNNIRKLFIFSVFMLAIACKNDIPLPPQTNSTIVVADKKMDWDILEKNVFETIDSVKSSTPSNRKKWLTQFMQYQSQVDGAIAEAYSHFAYDYVESECPQFLSVLTLSDTLLIKDWAIQSASELLLVAENTQEINLLLEEIKENHQKTQEKMDSLQIRLDHYYLENLIATCKTNN